MKKKWLFFCVFFIAVVCPTLLGSQLHSKCTISTTNNTVVVSANTDHNQLNTAHDGCFTLPGVSDLKNTQVSLKTKNGTMAAPPPKDAGKSFASAQQVSIQKNSNKNV